LEIKHLKAKARIAGRYGPLYGSLYDTSSICNHQSAIINKKISHKTFINLYITAGSHPFCKTGAALESG